MTRRTLTTTRIKSALLVFGLAGCVPQAEVIQGTLPERIAMGVRSGTGSFDHTEWDRMVRSYAVEGGARFDYGGMKREEPALDTYLSRLASAEVEALAGPEIMALFINAYNAYTVKTILNEVGEDGSYAVESIRDIPDVFTTPAHPVAGEVLSLDDMEHGVLRPIFRDPRVHFAVNCASISCPPLPEAAFSGEQLEDQLDTATRMLLGDPGYVSVDEGTVVLTRILDWFGDDFTDPANHGAQDSVVGFVAGYNEAVEALVGASTDEPPVRFLDYDWGLNRP